MDCTNQLNSEPSPMTTSMQEATGDSESDATALTVDDDHPSVTDDGDAESCSGSYARVDSDAEDDDDDDDDDKDGGRRRRIMSWRSWMVDSAMLLRCKAVDDDGVCSSSAAAEGGALAISDAESDRLFWEACIAHGY